MLFLAKHQRLRQGLIQLAALLMAILLPVEAMAEVYPVAYQRDDISRNGLVRVYLSSLGSLRTMQLKLKAGYTANGGEVVLNAGAQLTVSCNSSTGRLTLSSDGKDWNMGEYFTLNRSSADASLTIAQADTSNPYPADFSFRTTKKNGGYVLYPVAHIQMEDYLYGVLPYEMGNSSPLEALKAQAVAARTYTIRMMEKRASGQYDVVDTNADQVYKGTPSGNTNCKTAVDDTEGVVLRFGSKYAETYYSSSNGGQTESALNVWGGKGYEYLTVKDDPYDLASGAAKAKTVTIYKDLNHGDNRQALLTLLKEKAISVLRNKGYSATSANTSLIWLEDIELHTPKYASPSKLYTKADFVMTVETSASGGSSATTSVTVTVDVFQELESLLGLSLQSATNELWSVRSSTASFTLRSGRYGHGVGMSQYGAMEMARQGYAYDYILGFYYPGCTNVHLNLSSGPMQESGTGSTQTGNGESVGNPSSGESIPYVMGYATVLANGYLNLRQSPSMSAPILGIALEGETLSVLSQDGNWAYVEYNGLKAYALRSLLSDIFQQGGETETIPPENTPETTQAMIYSLNGSVNFRETAGLSSRVLMQLPHGTYVEVTGAVGEFSSIRYQGIQGYVMTSFLVFEEVNVPQAPSFEELPGGMVEQPSETTFTKATVTTARGSLNLRETPNDGARILKRIPQYSLVEAAVYNANWCIVRYDGVEGYAMSRFLTLSESSGVLPEAGGTIALPEYSIGPARVTTPSGSLNLRISPSLSAAVLRTIPRSKTVEVYSIEDEWALITYQEYTGYVMFSYLTMLDVNPVITEPEQLQAVPQSNPGDLDAEKEQKEPAEENTLAEEALAEELSAFMPEDLPEGFAVISDMLAVVEVDYANFRRLPSLNERILCVIPKGVELPVAALNDEWFLVVFEEEAGYVLQKELALYTEIITEP